MTAVEIQHHQPAPINQDENKESLLNKVLNFATMPENKSKREKVKSLPFLHKAPFNGTHNGKMTRGKFRIIKKCQNIAVVKDGEFMGYVWQFHGYHNFIY